MKTKFLFLGAFLMLLRVTVHADLVITTNTVPPVIGPYDQYYLPGPISEATNAMTFSGTNNTTSDANDILTYVAADRQSKGQTFTTGPNPAGYTISSVTVRHILWTNFLNNGTWMNFPNGAQLGFRFGTISGTNITSSMLTALANYSGSSLSMNGGSGTGIYFTFDLSGAGIGTLSPNTTYFFELASASAYFELHNTRTNTTSYTNGTAFYGDTVGQITQNGAVNLPPYGGEFAFVAKLDAVGAPSVTVAVDPASGSAGQSFTVTATVTPGAGTVTNVTVNLSAIGGSSAASLVLSNANVYTNTFTVPVGAPLGNQNLTVTATDNQPLIGSGSATYTVLPSDRTWNGGSSFDSKWSTGANWVGGLAPFTSGNNVFFAGTTRLTPDMNTNYSITQLVFSNNAGSFTIGSSTGGTLTIGNGVTNNSANAQTLNVPIVLGAAQTFNTVGGLTLNSNVTGGQALTKVGNGTLAFTGSGASAVGDLVVSQGLLKITNGIVTVTPSQGNTKVDTGGNIEVDGGVLMITNGVNSWFPIGDTQDGATNIMTVSGGAVIIRDFWGIEIPRQGNAVLNINSGSVTVDDMGGYNVGLIIGDMNTAQSGVLNLNGGTLVVDKITSNNGQNAFYFNGGTLKPTGPVANFFPSSATLSAYVRNSGAIVDTAGSNVVISQPLLHSVVAGDNAIDGGLTKIGNGTLNLNGVNTYTGPTVINGGTLGGTGTIAGPLTNNATLAPGNNSTLTINGDITLKAGSTNTFAVNGSTLAQDFIAAGASVTYGGLLNIVPGGTFTVGQQFQLFSGSGVASSSSFAGIAGSPGSGLAFSFTNGVLSVVAGGPSGPAQITNSLSGGVLSLSWPAGQGWRLQMQTNSLSTGLGTNWIYVTDGSINSTNITVDPTKPTTFFRLQYP